MAFKESGKNLRLISEIIYVRSLIPNTEVIPIDYRNITLIGRGATCYNRKSKDVIFQGKITSVRGYLSKHSSGSGEIIQVTLVNNFNRIETITFERSYDPPEEYIVLQSTIVWSQAKLLFIPYYTDEDNSPLSLLSLEIIYHILLFAIL